MPFDPSIFKAYDIRGIFPANLDNSIAYKIGQAYSEYVRPDGEVFVGEDVRLHSHELKTSLIEGLTDAGIDVVDVGRVSTDMIYFAVGFYRAAGGIQATASHSPAQWHGFKMTKNDAEPLTFEDGIEWMRSFVQSDKKIKSPKKGRIRKLDIWDDYVDFVLKWFPKENLQPMRVVINPNFGLAGLVFRKIVEKGKLPLEIIPINDVPDGSFPKGIPNPFVPENRVEFLDLAKKTEADLGITWDADADRVFFCTKGGIFVEPYFLNTILVKEVLAKFPGSNIVYDPRYIWAIERAIRENGGVPVMSVVGHSYFKKKMRETNAVFAVESSGHIYYRDFWYSDCGMIPIAQVLGFLNTNKVSLLDAVQPLMDSYFISGEINTSVENKDEKIEEIARRYSDARQSRFDGILVDYDDFRFCVRPSNTEPLLRLTLEAKSKKLMEEKRDEVLEIIRS
jgi:phosphomannomutase